MTIDPRVGMYFSIVMAIVSGLGICGTQFTTLFGAENSEKILAVIVVLNVVNGAINAVLHMIPSKAGAAQEFALGPKTTAPVILLAILILGALSFPGDASAQGRPPLQITGNPIADARANLGLSRPSGITGNPLGDIVGALDIKLLPDLQYALKLATASGSKVTAPCYQAWIDIINVRQKAVQDDGTPPQALPMPDPHLITDFEKLVELRNSLQPDSDFMIKCSPVASMVKKDIVGFIGIVISGGAGLATLVPGL